MNWLQGRTRLTWSRNEEKLREIQGLTEHLVAHFPQCEEATIDPSLAFPAMPET